jgi:hypothetical protein
MSGIPVDIAVEDVLSEFVVMKLLAVANRDYHVGSVYRRGGFSYLRSTINGWNAAAKGKPFVVLTDLDDNPCPAELLGGWWTSAQNSNLIFRVAVREVEAWLLADVGNIAEYLQIGEKHVPQEPDEIPDPKATLIGLARRSRLKYVRDSLLPQQGSTAKQGLGHNDCLGVFVREKWDVRTACARSPSLSRAMKRFDQFRPVFTAR